MKRFLCATLLVGFVGVYSDEASAVSYAHSAIVDTQAPINVTGYCGSSYENGWFDPVVSQPQFLGPDWYDFECRLKRNGSTVKSQLEPYVYTDQADDFSITSSVLSTPRQTNCIYCTKNQGYFFRDFHQSGTPIDITSTADKKDCATTGYGGGSGSGGEP